MRDTIGRVLVIVVVFMLGCAEEEVPVILQLRTTLNQVSGFQNQELINPLKFYVEDSKGAGVEGVELKVKIIEGDGQVVSQSEMTDATGLYIVEYRLGEEYSHKLLVQMVAEPDKSVEVSMRANYWYSVPSISTDGWEVADINSVEGIRTGSIFNGIQKIHQGDYNKMHSVLIVKDGKLMLESYFDGYDSRGNFIRFDSRTPHEQQSASKSFRSMLIGLAIDQGFISGTDVPVHAFFPQISELTMGGKEGILLEHLLTMSSGLDWDEWINPPNNLTHMYSLPANQWHEYVLERPLANLPGSKFVYNTGASILLNRVIENTSGVSLAEFTSEYFMSRTESSLLSGNSNLQANKLPRDMAKMGQVYLDMGKWKDNQVISAEWVEKSFQTAFEVQQVGADYGYQWWIRTFSTRKSDYTCYYASGNGGQFVMIIRELNLVVVFTGGYFTGGGHAFTLMTEHILPAFEP